MMGLFVRQKRGMGQERRGGEFWTAGLVCKLVDPFQRSNHEAGEIWLEPFAPVEHRRHLVEKK